jgi:two-component system sensor histidine kinase/response regulator
MSGVLFCMFRSLRYKIVIVLVVINAISFAAMTFINYEISNKQMNKQLISESMTNLNNTITNLNTTLSLHMKEAQLIGRSVPMSFQTIDQKLQYLQAEIVLSNISTIHTGVADLSGVMRMLDGTSLPVESFPAYHKALQGESAYTNPMLDEDGNPVLWLMVPIYNSLNGVQNVIGLAIDSTPFFQNLLSVHTEYKDSSIVLIDRDTNLLYYRDNSLILKRNYIEEEPLSRNFAEQLRNSNEGYGESKIFGRVLKLFYTKVPGFDWYAILFVSKKEFEAPLRNAMWINVGLIGLTEIILGSILYFITKQGILNRIKQVLAVTQKVASGDFYTQPLPIRSMDEMGTLAISINGMIDNLQNLFEPFQAFIRHNQYAMIVTDARFAITSFNSRAEEMLGYSEHEILYKKTLLLWHDQEQLEERAKFYSEKLKQSITADESVLFVQSHKGFLPDWEWKWINRDGTRILVSLNTSVMRHPDGTIKGYVLIARDISEIKQAVETNTRLMEIMESAHDMIASFDIRGQIFYLNQAGHTFLGIDKLNDQNHRLSLYMPIPTTIRFADGLTEAQRLGFWQSETEFIASNGQIHIASIIVVAHETYGGKDTFFSTIVRDISGQKEIERQLVKAKVEADNANEAKSSFLARMSHEIRTPLNGIIGLTYLLQRTELTEIQGDYLRQVSDSSQNLLHILNNILDFSKMEAAKLTLEHVPFYLEQSLQKLGGMFSVLLGPKPVDFIIHSDPEIPSVLIGDSTRLEQVLLNLGSNAIKFTKNGLIELRISLTELTDEQACLTFTVKDTGIGMTPEQRKQLFIPFVQADEKTSRKYGGTGLGLVISHTLVERMGGKITVQSAYQVGSSFSFRLTFNIGKDKTLQTGFQLPEFNILVLEDHPQVAEHWSQLLTSLGCKVVTLASWEQAKPVLHTLKWDLCMIDMEAGDMHGEETWTMWKNELDSLGIRVISSTTLLGRDALQQLPNALKPSAVLVKPSPSQQVKHTLQYLSEGFTSRTLKEQPFALEAGEAPIHRGRILVVDDQIINRLVAKQLLEQQGFEVESSESGSEALQLLEQSSVDLVLMDLHMPEMDGIETTVRIRNRFTSEELPVVALTADVTEEQHIRCLSSGMNDILTKPIQPELLLSVLSRWLSVKSQLAPYVTVSVDSEPWPETPGLNVTLALKRLDGKSKLYFQLLDKFLQQYVDNEQQLTRLLSDGDRKSAIRLVHSLSGASSHLGAFNVHVNASALERALQSNQDVDEEMAELNASLLEVLETIRNLILQKRN